MKNNGKPQVLYICNRQKCEHCIDECHHTADRFYSRDEDHEFVEIFGNLWEKPKDGDDWILDEWAGL